MALIEQLNPILNGHPAASLVMSTVTLNEIVTIERLCEERVYYTTEKLEREMALFSCLNYLLEQFSSLVINTVEHAKPSNVKEDRLLLIMRGV